MTIFFVTPKYSFCCWIFQYEEEERQRKRTVDGAEKGASESDELPYLPAPEQEKSKMKHMDGLLYHPTNRVVIESTHDYPDVVSNGPQTEPKQEGNRHCVITPERAHQYRTLGIKPREDGGNTIADFRHVEEIVHPIDGTRIKVPLRLTLLDSYDTVKPNGSTVDAKDMTDSYLHLTNRACKKEAKKHNTTQNYGVCWEVSFVKLTCFVFNVLCSLTVPCNVVQLLAKTLVIFIC